MTKQEYHDAISKAIATGRACGVCQTSIGHELNKIKDEYIASLEAKNAAPTLLHTQATDEMLKMQNRVHELEAENSTLKSSAIVWHKYPDEKPIEFGRYAIHRRHNVMPRIDIRYWTGNEWQDKEGAIYDRDIAFWAYLPAPPEEVSNER